MTASEPTGTLVLLTHKLCDDVEVADARSFPGRVPPDFCTVLGACNAHNKFFSQDERDELGRDSHSRAYWEALTADLTATDADRENPNAAPTAADALDFARAFLRDEGGRKATDDDLTPDRIAATTAWLRAYDGSFEFLLDVQRSLLQYGHLRVAQARGAFNCLLAQVKREQAPATAVVQGSRPVVDGIYTVVLNSVSGTSNHVTLKLHVARSKKYQNVSVLQQGGFTTVGGLYDGTSFRFWRYTRDHDGDEQPLVPSSWTRQRHALDVLLQSDDAARVAAGKAYALASGQCFRCDALLTDPPSIALGLGPTCKTYFGY